MDGIASTQLRPHATLEDNHNTLNDGLGTLAVYNLMEYCTTLRHPYGSACAFQDELGRPNDIHTNRLLRLLVK